MSTGKFFLEAPPSRASKNDNSPSPWDGFSRPEVNSGPKAVLYHKIWITLLLNGLSLYKFLPVLLLMAGLARPQLSPCETYACDSTVVQSILDANGLSQYSPVDVTQRDTLSGRIILLSLNRGDDLTGVKILPNEVGRLTALRKLWLTDQDIKEFPRGIGQLTLLEDLILHGNMLESLPDEIKNLTGLQRLVLSGNPLQAFPPAITGLKELHYLSVGGSGVDSLPDDLWGLTALTELSITNTSMRTLPGAVAGLLPIPLDLTPDPNFT